MTTPTLFSTHSPRLLAGLGTLTLLTGIGLLASRPAHTAGGPISVSVANASLATTPTDNPAKKGVQFSVNLVIGANYTQAAQFLYPVPTGRRLVIDSVTAAANGLGDKYHYSLYYDGTGGFGNGQGYGYFNVVPDGSPYSAGQSHGIVYVEANQQVYVEVDRTETIGISSVNVSFAGHLVDIATPGGSS